MDTTPTMNDSNMEIDEELIYNSASYNNLMVDSTDFDWAQIIYALNYKRLMFISNYKTWQSFHSENTTNGYKYMDYTPEQLSTRFNLHVLPHIYDYELTEDEEHLLNVLGLHPNFHRTERGFNILEQMNNSFTDVVIKKLMDDNFTEEFNFEASEVNVNNQIVVADADHYATYRKFIFSQENAALLSVILTSDSELPNCQLLTMDKIHYRLKEAKNRFALNGQQPENINIPVDDLLQKLKTITELKTAIRELVDKSFRE